MNKILKLNKISIKSLLLRFNLVNEYMNIINYVFNNMFINYNNINLIIDNIINIILMLKNNDLNLNLNPIVEVKLYNKDLNYLKLNNRHFLFNDLLNNIIESVFKKNTKNLERFNLNNISFDTLKDIQKFLLNNKNFYVLKCNDKLINDLNIKYVYYHNDNNINIQFKIKGTKNYILIYYTTFDNNHVYIISTYDLIKRLNNKIKLRKTVLNNTVEDIQFNFNKLKLNYYYDKLLLNNHDKKEYISIDSIYEYDNYNLESIKTTFEDLTTFESFIDYKICLLSYRKNFIKSLKDFNKIKGYYDLTKNKKNSYSKALKVFNDYHDLLNDLIFNDLESIKDILFNDYNNYYDLSNILDKLESIHYFNHKYLDKCLFDLIKYVNDLLLDIQINTNNHYDLNDNFNDYDNYKYNIKDCFLYHKNSNDKY